MVNTQFADVVGGLLSLNTGPLSLNSTVSASTLTYIPVVHRYISLFNGTRYDAYDIGASGISLAFTLAANTQGEAYVRAVGSTPTLSVETGTTVVRVDGIPVKSGDPTRRHVGTVYGWTSANTIMWRPRADSATVGHPHLGIWNRYNQRQLVLEQNDTTDTWSYGTATWRPVRNAWRLEFVVDPLGETLVNGHMYVDCACVARTPISALSSLNNNTDGFGTVLRQGDSNGSSPGNGFQTCHAKYLRSWNGGFKTLYPLELSSAATSFYGDDGVNGVRSVAYASFLG